MKKIIGFTLLELMIVLAMMSILLFSSLFFAPHFLAKHNAQKKQMQLLQLLETARNTAFLSKQTLTLRHIGDRWHDGAILFVDDNQNGNYDSTEKVLRQIEPFSSNELFDWRGFQDVDFLQWHADVLTKIQNGTFTYQRKDYPDIHWKMTINRLGKVH